MAPAGQYETIVVSRSGEVVEVSLNRPDVRNAFNARMIAELTDAFTEISDSDARAVVLSGNGPSFSAGADVTWMRQSLEYTHEQNLADAQRMSDMFAAIDRCAVPTVARVHGAALGGGMGLMAVCDIVVAAEGTVFGFTETKLGIIPAVISRFVLPKIGESWARALFSTGERFGVDLAQRVGLVHWVTTVEEIGTLVEQKIAELCNGGPTATREAKALVLDSRGLVDDDVRTLTVGRIAALRTSDEGQEGLHAFLERRPPSWRQ